MKDKNRPINVRSMSSCRLHKYLQSKGYLQTYSVPAKDRYLIATLREYLPELCALTVSKDTGDIIIAAAQELELNLNRSPKVKPLRSPVEWSEQLKAEIRAEKAEAKAAKKKKHRPAAPQRPKYSQVMGDAFLQSFEWKRVRMQALKLYGSRCQCCGATSAESKICVDHIKPRRLYPELALDINNLQILCHDCNHGKGNWDMTDWRPKTDPMDVANARYYAEQLEHMRDISNKGGDSGWEK